MRLRRFAGAFILLAAACFHAACAAVPDIRFVPDDAASADGSGGRDGGADSARDGGPDAPPVCTEARPDADATCCGPFWCVGECTPSSCDECTRKGCPASDLCCAKGGTAVCNKARCQ